MGRGRCAGACGQQQLYSGHGATDYPRRFHRGQGLNHQERDRGSYSGAERVPRCQGRCGLGLDSRHDDSGQCARLWECRAALASWTLRPTDGAGGSLRPAIPIYSGGMADLSFTADGQPVQLRPSKPATLRLQLSEEVEAAFNADNRSDRYSRCGFFDFATGYWHRDGGCTVRAGRTGRRSARARVSHFTPWNVDWPSSLNDRVQVQVVDAKSKRPLPSAQVLLSAVEIPAGHERDHRCGWP